MTPDEFDRAVFAVWETPRGSLDVMEIVKALSNEDLYEPLDVWTRLMV